MSIFGTILIVDDEKNSRMGLRQFLEGKGYEILDAGDGEEALALFQETKPDLVLADIRMPKLDGISLLEKIKLQSPDAFIILMTAYGAVDDAVKAMKKGAYYYLTKPINLDELDFLVRKAFSSRTIEEENRELRQALFNQKFDQGKIIGKSKKITDLLKTVDKIAQTNATVLIEGESGTGKELIAHRIHNLSTRSGHPFVAVHCAALTETLLASELFGHEKGAFTGASERKIGRFERAHQGTLFLDEVGEISLETQVKLLRVLQGGEFERVGGTKTLKVDVRLICATNKNLRNEVAAGRFREDLYYRINVIYLRAPSLREHKEDIPLLVEYFLKHFAEINRKKNYTMTQEALDALMHYDWPGNIREFKNIIERMIVLSSEPTLDRQNVPEDLRQDSSTGKQELEDIGPTSFAEIHASANLTDMEKILIRRILTKTGGNKSMAAKKLGISRRTLYRKIEDYKL